MKIIKFVRLKIKRIDYIQQLCLHFDELCIKVPILKNSNVLQSLNLQSFFEYSICQKLSKKTNHRNIENNEKMGVTLSTGIFQLRHFN